MKVHFDINVIRFGQPREYTDKEIVVVITDHCTLPLSDNSKKAIILQIMYHRYPPRRGTPIDSTETLDRRKDGTWIFKQHMPFTD